MPEDACIFKMREYVSKRFEYVPRCLWKSLKTVNSEFMPRIFEAEFLYYRNPAQNSDKVYNLFVIENDNGTFSCVTEYGRRGGRLSRDNAAKDRSREAAEDEFRKKLNAKLYHRRTPYLTASGVFVYSPFAEEYRYALPTVLPKSVRSNVIEFPKKCLIEPEKKRPAGILNQEQLDSLEI